MIATISNQVQTQTPLISPEIMALALDKTVAAQVIAWDTFGEINPAPEEITGVFTSHDILKFVLNDGRAILIGDDQFLHYWEQIQRSKKQVDELPQEEIVSLAKTSGTAIWERGCKLGYVVRFASVFYAVSETLVYGRGFQYSHSRHSSFQLAHDALIEQSWVEEEA